MPVNVIKIWVENDFITVSKVGYPLPVASYELSIVSQRRAKYIY